MIAEHAIPSKFAPPTSEELTFQEIDNLDKKLDKERAKLRTLHPESMEAKLLTEKIRGGEAIIRALEQEFVEAL